jgi:hypothetical protein
VTAGVIELQPYISVLPLGPLRPQSSIFLMAQRSQSPTGHKAGGRDDIQLPKGQCRYLLLHPEVRGQRCACVGFSLHRATPGSSCNCGHQAVYHLPTATTEETVADRDEIEILRSKVSRLEELLDGERNHSRHSLAMRISELEELVDKRKAEVDSEVKSAYRGMEGIWHHVGLLERRAKSYDDRIEALEDARQATQEDLVNIQKRLIDVDEANMFLEERLDSITSINSTKSSLVITTPAISDRHEMAGLSSTELPDVVDVIKPTNDTRSAKAWTVHISLMPTASQPFPFEKDTHPYKRCLSRGLHRVVAIPGVDSKSFVEATSKAFKSLLQGRVWMPLVAKLCDAQNLMGLPMLRQLPPQLVDAKLYDRDFLKQHCATLDPNGNILDLYIAMCNDTFAWSELRASPVFLAELEACWDFDPLLDGLRQDEEASSKRSAADEVLKVEDKQSAGDLLRAWSPPTTRLKRAASARTSSFGSTDGEGKRTKIQHQCAGPAVERVDRRAEAV